MIAALPAAEQKRLKPFLERVDVKLHDVLIEADEPIKYIYFPVTGLGSIVQTMNDGSAVETGIVGLEGFIGTQVWLGQKTAPVRIFVQVPGEMLRMKRETFIKEVMKTESPLNEYIASYIDAYISMTSVTSACNRLHQINQRMCRWLKMVHNRAEGDSFPMRHEFLAYMLGVHRPSVSIAAGILKKEGLISYERGRLKVLDSKGLAKRSCECYETIEKHFEKIFDQRIRK